MKRRQSLAALALCLLAGTAFAATPAATTTNPAPATPAASAKAPAKAHAASHCKKGETMVKGKCEKPKS